DPVGDAELVVDVLQVGPDRGLAQVEVLADLHGAQTVGGQAQDLQLAGAEYRAVVGGSPQPDLAGEAVLHGGRDHRLAPGHREYRVHDLAGGAALGQVGVRPDGDGLVDDGAVVSCRDEQGAGRQRLALEGVQDPQPVDLRQRDVQYGDVGTQQPNGLQRFAAVPLLGEHLDLGSLAQHADQPVAVERMVVGDHDADAPAPRPDHVVARFHVPSRTAS